MVVLLVFINIFTGWIALSCKSYVFLLYNTVRAKGRLEFTFFYILQITIYFTESKHFIDIHINKMFYLSKTM